MFNGLLPRTAPVAVLALGLVFLSACPRDPYDPKTWIDKLNDSKEWEKAVVELDQLHDPVAIEPLGHAWVKYSRHPKILRAIISLADQPTDKGGPYWDKAVPILKKAVDEVNVSARRSVEDAIIAAEALGKSKDPGAVDVLVRAALKSDLPRLNLGQSLRIAAVRALGNFGQSPRAIETLIKVLQMDVEKQPEHVNGAAAAALAASGSQQALQPLLIALYDIPRIYRQVRGGLIRMRSTAAPELIKVMRGEHKELEDFAKKNDFANDCASGEGPRTKCKAPGNLDFKAAAILGDMRSAEAVPALLADLRDGPQIAFFNPKTGEPGPTDHSATLDALRKIGDPSAAGPVLEYIKDEKTDDDIRPMAIDVYSFLARGGEGADWLVAQMKDDAQDEETRKAAALAYGRMVYEQAQLEPIQWLIDRYRGQAKKLEADAAGTKDEAKKAEHQRDARGYQVLALLFDQHRARALPGIKCKQDPACYSKLLALKSSEALDLLGISKPDQEKLGRGDREAYRIAIGERCLLELGKLGPKAQPALAVLLEHAGSRDRIIRQGALIALIHVAPKPCKECIDKLTAVVAGQQGNDTLSELNVETELVLEYFSAK